MAAGAMRDRVRLERRTTVSDGYGNSRGEWSSAFERAAEIRPLKGGEGVIGARLEGTQPAMVRVRFDSQTSEIKPDWRLVEVRSGTVYAIKTAADMERRREFVTMMCVAGDTA